MSPSRGEVHDLISAINNLDSPWPQAFAIRCILRTFPIAASIFGDVALFDEGRAGLAVEVVRYVYLAAYRFEQGYRARLDLDFTPDVRIEKEFTRTRNQLGRELDRLGQWRAKFGLVWEVALLLAQQGTDEPYLAGRTIRSIKEEIDRHSETRSFSRPFIQALEEDWESCLPLDSQKIRDVEKFFSQQLWPPHLSARSVGAPFSKWKEMIGKASDILDVQTSDVRFNELAELHFQHLHGRALRWEAMLRVLLPPGAAPVDQKTRRAFLDLVNEPQHVTALLAQIAFHDRSWCELASRPSLSLFKEAVEALGRAHPTTLLSLARNVDGGPTGFQPSKVWLAWVQNTHQPVIESIQSELRSWLPVEGEADSGSAPTEHRRIVKQSSVRKTAKRPAPKRK